MCWPTNAPEGSARFATSKELLDHSRIDHALDPPGGKPFRCALAGCGKAWKVFSIPFHAAIFFVKIKLDSEWCPVSFTSVMSPTGYFSLSNLRCFRSTAHFRTALSSSFSAQRAENGPARSHPSSGPSADSDSNDGVKRAHVCHHQHCFKAYRQSSGLRYHLRHVKSSLHHEVSFTNLSVGTSGGNARPAQCCSPDCRA